MTATDKQLAYIDGLVQRHNLEGSWEEALAEINPDLEKGEDFMEWAGRQDSKTASEVIEILLRY